MMDLLNRLILIAFLTAGLSSCYYDKAEELYPSQFECDPNKSMSYGNDVLPILEQHCLGCHDENNYQSIGGNILLNTPELAGSNSKLIDAINHNANASAMPKGGLKLSDCEIITIESWINQGANDN